MMRIHGGRRRREEAITAWIMILPMLLVCLVLYAIPCVMSFAMSLTETNGYQSAWVGLKNFKTLFTKDKYFWAEFWNTLYFAFASIGLGMVASIYLARALESGIRGKHAYRLFFYIPAVTMAAVVGVVWRQLLNSEYGLINQILAAFGIAGPRWLSDPSWLMPGVILVSLWSGTGTRTVVLMAGMQSISRTYYEAAEIDGVTGRQRFFHITLPLLTPTLFYCLVTGLIGAFKSFDLLYMFVSVAGADRYASRLRVLTYGIYKRGFLDLKMGMGSAEAVVLFVLLLLLTWFQFWSQKRWVHYDEA